MKVSKSPTLVVLVLAAAIVVVVNANPFRAPREKALDRRWWWMDSEEVTTKKPAPVQVQAVQDQVQVDQVQDQTSQDQVLDVIAQNAPLQEAAGQQVDIVPGQHTKPLLQQQGSIQQQPLNIVPGHHTKPLRPPGFHTKPLLQQQASIQQQPLNIVPGDLTKPLERPQYALRELTAAERSERWFWDNSVEDQVQVDQVQDQTSQDQVLDDIAQNAPLQEPAGQQVDIVPGQHTKPLLQQQASIQQQPLNIVPGDLTKPLERPQYEPLEQQTINVNPGDLTRPLQRPQYALRELTAAERSERWFWDNSVEDRSDELERQRFLNRKGPATNQRQELLAGDLTRPLQRPQHALRELTAAERSDRWFWDNSVEDRSDELERQRFLNRKGPATNQRQQLPARNGQASGGRFYDSPEFYSNELYSNELYSNELYSNELYDRSDELRRQHMLGNNPGIHGRPTQGGHGISQGRPNQGRPNQGRPTQGGHGVNQVRPTQGGNPGIGHGPALGGNHNGGQNPAGPNQGGPDIDIRFGGTTAGPIHIEQHQGGHKGGAQVPAQ